MLPKLADLADGTHSSGQILAAVPENDIAVLAWSLQHYSCLPPESGAMRIGDEAFVVGNPFGLYSSMSWV
jgi:S1-C subfamily serine protease